MIKWTEKTVKVKDRKPYELISNLGLRAALKR
jgi:hypothetical protein